MSLIGIFTESPEPIATLLFFTETVWPLKGRKALVRMRCVVQSFSNSDPFSELSIVVAHEVMSAKDVTFLLLDDDYQRYRAEVIYAFPIKVDKANKTVIEPTVEYRVNPLIRDPEIQRGHGYSTLRLSLSTPIKANEIHCFMIEFIASDLVEGGGFWSPTSFIEIRVLTLQAPWTNKNVMELFAVRKRSALSIKQGLLWVGVPAGHKIEYVNPTPIRVGRIMRQHPGYDRKVITTIGRIGVRWVIRECEPYENLSFTVIYSAKPLPRWLIYVSIAIGLLSLLLNLLLRLFHM